MDLMLRIFGVFWLIWSVLIFAMIIFAVIELLDDDLKDKDRRREREN